MDSEPSVRLLNAEKERVQISRLLLVALVQNGALSLTDAAIRLARWLEFAHAPPSSFFFDLGWRESMSTAFSSLANLNWVSEHHSELMYEATQIGVSHLEDHVGEVEAVMGCSLEKLQAI